MRAAVVELMMRGPRAAALRGCPREVYRLLLRLAKQDTGLLRFGRVGDARIEQETGYSKEAIKRARKHLVAVGLIEVLEVGSGRVRTAYRVVLEFAETLEELPLAAGAEHLAGVAQDPSGGSTRPPRGGQDDPPYAHAFPVVPPCSSVFPQPPDKPGASEAGLAADPSPATSSPGSELGECARARERGERCRSCRRCGTSPRQQQARLDAARDRAAAERRAHRERAAIPRPAEDAIPRPADLAERYAAARAASTGRRTAAAPPGDDGERSPAGSVGSPR